MFHRPTTATVISQFRERGILRAGTDVVRLVGHCGDILSRRGRLREGGISESFTKGRMSFLDGGFLFLILIVIVILAKDI
jgi:hypothetical protein